MVQIQCCFPSVVRSQANKPPLRPAECPALHGRARLVPRMDLPHMFSFFFFFVLSLDQVVVSGRRTTPGRQMWYFHRAGRWSHVATVLEQPETMRSVGIAGKGHVLISSGCGRTRGKRQLAQEIEKETTPTRVHASFRLTWPHHKPSRSSPPAFSAAPAVWMRCACGPRPKVRLHYYPPAKARRATCSACHPIANCDRKLRRAHAQQTG